MGGVNGPPTPLLRLHTAAGGNYYSASLCSDMEAHPYNARAAIRVWGVGIRDRDLGLGSRE